VVTVIRAARCVRMIADGRGTIFDDVGNCRPAHIVTNLEDRESAAEGGDVAGGQSGDARQVGPLVVEWLQRAVLAAPAVQRGRD
jgi:hypothetical protein